MRKTTALVRVEGVLGRDGTTGAVFPEGKRFLEAVLHRYDLWFVTEVVEERHDRVNNWLHDEAGINAGMKLIGPAEADPVGLVRSLGYAVDLFITQNPDEAARAMSVGVTAILFAAPAYQRAEFRPDGRRGVRAWDSIVTEIAAQKEQAAGDTRTTVVDDLRFE